MKQNWDQIKQIITENHSFVLTTHLNPDGDGLGSEVALAEYLKSLKKDVSIINYSPTPYNYRFLDPFDEILHYDNQKHLDLFENADVFFILDISDWGRMREVGTKIRSSSKIKICIDHHYCPAPLTKLDFIDTKVSSTGELIYDLLNEIGATLNNRMAESIYTSILTDTGSFRFSNTTPKAHKIASRLIKEGVNSHKIYQQVYEQNSQSKMNLLGLVLQNLKFECDGKLTWFNITQKMLKQVKANPWDIEGFADFPRSIRGVEVSLMFAELDQRRTKVSFRSKGRIVVNSVAMMLGGGGHEFASGALMEYPLRETNSIVIEETMRLFNHR